MSLTKNVGSADQIIRILAGIVLIALALFKLGGLTATGGLIASVVGIVLIFTAAINFCPIYRILGMSTTKKQANAE